MTGTIDYITPEVRLLLLLELQQYEGCGDAKCPNRHCFSNRSNRSPPARRPARATARAMAHALASTQKPHDLLCPRLQSSQPLPPMTSSQINASHDAGSFEQTFARTKPIVNAFDSYMTVVPPQITIERERDAALRAQQVVSPTDTPIDAGREWLRLYQSGSSPSDFFYARQAPIPYQASFFRSICYRRMSQGVLSARRVRKLAELQHQKLHSPLVDIIAVRALGLDPRTAAPDPIRPFQFEYTAWQIRRSRIIDDAFQLLDGLHSQAALRPLRIKLYEPVSNIDERRPAVEPAIDQGGVGQEFFSAFFAAAFATETGLMVTDSESNKSWFNLARPFDGFKYRNLGSMMALGIHNGFVLPVRLPLAFYMKLTDDLPKNAWDIPIKDGWPSWYRQFRYILSCDDDDVFDQMCLSFSYPLPADNLDLEGNPQRVPKSQRTDQFFRRRQRGPNAGEDLGVTKDNRFEFVSSWVEWTVNELVAVQWRMFSNGFYRIIPKEILRSISPEALQRIVEGEPHVDIDMLEKFTKYEHGTKAERIVVHFWSVLRELDQTLVSRLVRFVTGSDRLRAGDGSATDFTIHLLDMDDDEHLPQSSTCTRTLKLPRYSSREILAAKLKYVLENEVGFGNL